MTVLIAFVTAVLFGCGAWLLMQRRLSRIILGVGMLGHGANLLLVTSGGTGGRIPIIGADDVTGAYADPLPQALALTAIVITFGVTAFLLALGFRSWQITRDDRVEDDVEDRLIARLELAQPALTEDEEGIGIDYEPSSGPAEPSEPSEPGARTWEGS